MATLKARGDGAPPRVGSPVTSRSLDAELARSRVLVAAGMQFRERGYDRTSLAEVGAAAGLTRGAVLYHFQSKANLLSALLKPFTAGLDATLITLESADPPSTPAAVLEAALDLLTGNRVATDLLARDIATPGALGLDEWIADRAGRLVRLLAPESDADTAAHIHGYAALGAMIRPLAHLSNDLISSRERDAILSAALGALRQ